MTSRYFYELEGELCYHLDTIKDMISSEGLKQKEVFKAKRITGEGVAWCTEYCTPLESGGGECGKICPYWNLRKST